VWLGDAEISDAVTDFRATNAPRSLRIVITDRTANVSGMVIDGRQRSVADYRVIVFADDERRLSPRSRFVSTAAPSPAGRFTAGGLLPGKYLICAVDYLEDGSWTDLDVLRRLRSIATPLTLAEGDKQVVTLTLRALP
jgi:hypothetical protein